MSDLSERMRSRIALRNTDSYIVNPVFPNGAAHCITGPPDIGKSTFTFQFLYEYDHRRPVFGGMECKWVPWVYISLDRGLRDTDRTLTRLGYKDWDCPVYSHEECIGRDANGKIDVEPNIWDIHKKFEWAELLVIEGLQGYLPNTGKGQALNKAHMLWFMQLRDQVLNKGVTIIFVTHTPKASDQTNDRENMLGSQSLIGAFGTVGVFDVQQDDALFGQVKKGQKGRNQTDARLMSFMPKNSPKIYLNYSRGPNGSFYLDSRQDGGTIYQPETGIVAPPAVELFDTPDDKMMMMDLQLSSVPPHEAISLSVLNNWCRSAGLNSQQQSAWIAQVKADGRLVSEGPGSYRRTSVRGRQGEMVQ